MKLFILVHQIINQLIALGAPYFTMSPSIWQLIQTHGRVDILEQQTVAWGSVAVRYVHMSIKKKKKIFHDSILYPIYIPPRYIPCIVMSPVSIYPLYFQCIPIISLLYVSPFVHTSLLNGPIVSLVYPYHVLIWNHYIRPFVHYPLNDPKYA